MKLSTRAKSDHVEGAVHHRRRHGADQSCFRTGAAERGARRSRRHRTARQPQGVDGHQARRGRRRRRDQRRRHRQISRHQSVGGAAAHHRRLDRPPQRRRRHGHGARLRPAVQHGHAEWPADAGSGRIRQRRRRPAAAWSAIRARSISPISPRNPSARSRSTRPAARMSPPAASAHPSTCAPRGRSTTTAWCSISASRRWTTPPTGWAKTSRRNCRASSAMRTTTRRSVSACRRATQKRDSGNSNATVNDWHIQRWDSNLAGNQLDRAVVRQYQRHAVQRGGRCRRRDDRERSRKRPALRHSERHPLRVFGFEARARSMAS